MTDVIDFEKFKQEKFKSVGDTPMEFTITLTPRQLISVSRSMTTGIQVMNTSEEIKEHAMESAKQFITQIKPQLDAL